MREHITYVRNTSAEANRGRGGGRVKRKCGEEGHGGGEKEGKGEGEEKGRMKKEDTGSHRPNPR